ncbi:hypothetical protein Q9189_000486 [Teloschistes chrysophthalmus]
MSSYYYPAYEYTAPTEGYDPPVYPSVHPFQRQMEIVKEYHSIKTIHPAVKALEQPPAEYQMLKTVMTNQYKLMLGRSRNIADCEITVFEAAFMVLMQDAKAHHGALYLFVEEILGLKLVAQPQKQEVLKEALKIHSLLLNLAASTVDQHTSTTHPMPSKEASSTYNRPDGYGYGKTTVLESNPSMPRHTNDVRTSAKERTSSSTADFDRELGFNDKAKPDLASYMDNPRLSKLFNLYENAKKEFQTSNPSSDEYLKVTKFLRDTAENCIQYLSSINAEDARLDELRETFVVASTVMTKNMGGLRRRFDYDWNNTPKGPSMPTSMSRREKKKLSRMQRWSYDGKEQSGAALRDD